MCIFWSAYAPPCRAKDFFYTLSENSNDEKFAFISHIRLLLTQTGAHNLRIYSDKANGVELLDLMGRVEK